MNKYIYTSILLLFFCLSLKCQKVDFKKTMDRLEKNVMETTDHGVEDQWYGVMNLPDLLLLTIIDDKDLYYVFSHPLQFKARLLKYINNDSVKWEYKYFALGLLQGLCIEEYLPIAENIYNLFDRKITSPPVDLSKPIQANNFHPSLDVLKLSIEQGGLSLEICKNSNNLLLKTLLNRIIKNENIPKEIKKYCNEILSGSVYREKKKNLQMHLLTIPIFECKNDKPHFYSPHFYLSN